MSVLGIRHVGLVVKNLELSVRFYCALLGFIVVDHGIESGSYFETMLDLPESEACIMKLAAPDGNRLELLCFTSHLREPQPRDLCAIGYSHIAFTVDDVDKLYAKFQQYGIRCLSEPQLTASGHRVFFARDPESNYLEFTENLH